MNTSMRCPSCAEEILAAAKKCPFCGQEISDAHRMGFPEFCESIVQFGFDPGSMLHDYEKACSGTFGEFNSNHPLTTILLGVPPNLNLVRAITVKLFERVEELAKMENLAGISAVSSNFNQLTNEELRSIFIFAEYFRSCSVVTEIETGADRSGAISTFRRVLEDLRRLHGLANSLGSGARFYQEMMETDIASVEERIRTIDTNQREGPAVVTPSLSMLEPRQTSRAWLLYFGFGVIVLILFIAMN